MSVSDAGEFGLIARIIERLGAADAVLLGPGDDAAVVAAPDGRVVAATDVLVEGRHFRRDWSSATDVGHRAAAQSLADVAAMGARPTALLVGLGAPGDLPVDWVDGLADGLREECARVGAAVVGGDVVRSEPVLLSVTALGDLQGHDAVTRAGARPGDEVVLVGRIGFAAAGLAMLLAGRGDDPICDAHRRPLVAYDAALALARSGATAMIDVSDGLASDLGHVMRASGVGVELVADALPVAPAVRAAAARLGVDPLEWVLAGGDDHAFVATIASSDLATAADRVGGAVGLHRIGRVVDTPGLTLLGGSLPGAGGHDHFRP